MEEKSAVIYIVIIATVVLALLVAGLLVLMLAGRNRKLKFVNERLEMETHFQEELMKTQVEVADSTLNDVASELHDNIGQMLTLTLMQLNRITLPEAQPQVRETYEVVQQAINELRSMSKDLSSDYIKSLNLKESLQRIFDRIGRSGLVVAEMHFPEHIYFHTKDKELILFRMVQELINNSLKHAQATEMLLSVLAEGDEVKLEYKDNGLGFEYKEGEMKNGLGLSSIMKRAKLLKASHVKISTAPNHGFKFNLNIPM
jgi:signal transduction histidine kinase